MPRDYFTNTVEDAAREAMFEEWPEDRPSPDEYEDDFVTRVPRSDVPVDPADFMVGIKPSTTEDVPF